MYIKRLGNWMVVARSTAFHSTIPDSAGCGFYPTPGYKGRKFAAHIKFGSMLMQVYPATLEIRA